MSHSEITVDSLDRKILKLLQHDSRMPFLEISKKLDVAPGTIHSRVAKLKDSGIISGSRITLDRKKLGYTVTCFIGVKVNRAGSYEEVLQQLKKLKEIVEIHYTTGSYSLFLKVIVPFMDDLHILLSKKIQTIPEISSTESFIVLDSPTERGITP